MKIVFAAGVLLTGVAFAGTWSVPGMVPDERPRVLFGPGEDGAVRDRLPREPYASIYLKVVEMAGREHPPDDHDVSMEQQKGNTAQAAAFVYTMNRTARREGDAVVVSDLVFPRDVARQVDGTRDL